MIFGLRARRAMMAAGLLSSGCASVFFPRPYGEQVDRLLQQHRSEFYECLAGKLPPVRLDLHFKIGVDGRVSDSSVPGANEAEQACFGRALRAIAFPTREGKGFLVFVYPFRMGESPDS